MEALFHWLQLNFPFIIEHKHVFLFLGAAIEGMNTIILGGFLASIGSISFLPIFLLCILGETLNGYAWYAVGYYAGAKPIDKWGRSKPKSRKIIEIVERYFQRYSGRAIIFTKLTWSLTIATLIMAGSFKYDLKKFSKYNFLGSVGWVSIMFFIGYAFGKSYKQFFEVTNALYIVVFLAAAIAVIYILKVIFRSKFIQSLYAMEMLRGLSERIRDGIDYFIGD